jgi:hypothetical protein
MSAGVSSPTWASREGELHLREAILLILARHVGRENRIPRPVLLHQLRKCLEHRVSDRRMRAAIEELRETGTAICSSSSDGGYFLAKDVQEIELTIAEYKSRMESFNHTLSSLGQAADQMLARPLEQGRLIP